VAVGGRGGPGSLEPPVEFLEIKLKMKKILVTRVQIILKL
jgi:hypothetical protein